MNLRELDARFIPDLARRTQQVADRVRRAHDAGLARVAALRPAPTGASEIPAGPAPTILRLRALDAKYARRGVLALIRDVPQIGALLVALLVVGNGAAVMQRSDRDEQRVATTPEGLPAPIVSSGVDGGTVGPEIGDSVDEYVQKADRELQERLAADPRQRSFASVSLTDYRTPQDALTLLGDVPGFRVFYRVPSSLDTEVREVQIRRFVIDTLAEYERVAAKLRGDIPDLISQGASTEDPAFKADYQLTARKYAQEAEALERGCACVFAVAVIATNEALFALRKVPGVRVIDVAPAGSGLDTIVFTGLRPEEKVTVTNGNEKRDAQGNVIVGG
ncbi:MAG TPA: hypothetical protein VNA14_13185 [Mycobacteriales bacterium]|nr:hypothetical protein [Mycobacteriales bacterium]